ncbi:MAG: tRNA pseudouridine(55) synthase TruB, partial [Halanaerobium sp.]|nr:tRNA pseudouridine(55) synthase TruB [Halanaerobium sp.]
NALAVRKAGHTGTLDPGAAGVLPVCLGKATRIAEYLTGETKEYRAEVMLGIATTTEDAFGEVVERSEKEIRLQQIREVLPRFLGEIEQVPPIFSALKHKGQRLYELARKGQEVEVEPRQVRISRLELLKFSSSRLLLDVECTSGTYIRSLARDLGIALGIPAHLSFLLRTRSGGFGLTGAVTPEELVKNNEGAGDGLVMSIPAALSSLPAIFIESAERRKAVNGAPLRNYLPGEVKVEKGDLVRVFTRDKEFISIGRIGPTGTIKAVKVFA